jgi:hypothetical protein
MITRVWSFATDLCQLYHNANVLVHGTSRLRTCCRSCDRSCPLTFPPTHPHTHTPTHPHSIAHPVTRLLIARAYVRTRARMACLRIRSLAHFSQTPPRAQRFTASRAPRRCGCEPHARRQLHDRPRSLSCCMEWRSSRGWASNCVHTVAVTVCLVVVAPHQRSS